MKARVNVSGHPFQPLGEVEITLSRRNILALLHKLDWPESARTVQKYIDGVLLTIVAEDDEEHYGDDAAGVMHDKTERFIEAHKPYSHDDNLTRYEDDGGFVPEDD